MVSDYNIFQHPCNFLLTHHISRMKSAQFVIYYALLLQLFTVRTYLFESATKEIPKFEAWTFQVLYDIIALLKRKKQ